MTHQFMKIKDGYYIDKNEEYFYLFSKELGKFFFLGDKTETLGFTEYTNKDLSGRVKFLGKSFDDVIRYKIRHLI